MQLASNSQNAKVVLSHLFPDLGWKGLTEEDIEQVSDRFNAYQCQVSEIARAIEATLRDRNA